MAAAITFPLMTVDQYEALPEPKGNFTYELQFGRLVRVGRPKKGHALVQFFIRELLRKTLDPKLWFTDTELAYNLWEGYDARAADVGVVSMSRFKKVARDSWLIGSPELVVFVKSRSNTDKQVEQNAIDCLTHGAEAVWYAKERSSIVYVYTASGKREYRRGQSIPLPASMSGRIKVAEIFRDL